MTPEQAREAILDGAYVRMIVGTDPEDPVLHLHMLDGMVWSNSVAGWSAGVIEAVCAADSDYLIEHLSNRHALTLID